MDRDATKGQLVVDQAVALAMSMQSNPGAYAVLFGSGVSYSSGIPTGWGIICDLVERVARMHGEDVGDDPAGWYETRYGKEPDYAELLEAVAHSPSERSALLRSYFEPTDEERREGLKQPTQAHRALARLAKAGVVKTFVTTNFDRLMEQALDEVNVVPTVIANPDQVAAAGLTRPGQVMVVKVHGDYRDARIKNTPDELASYEPAMDAVLDRVITDHGFIMCGWSGLWDTALVEAFLRAPEPQIGTWWANRRPPKGPAAKLLAARRGEFLPIDGADEFFATLADRVLGEQREEVTSPAHTQTIPVPLTAFVGREAELDELQDLVRTERLVTLHALGGGGKTRTAVEVARRAAAERHDGATFVDLTGTDDPDRVPVLIANTLGYAPTKLHGAMAPRDHLIVLDNCEHVVDAVAAFTADLLRAAPNVTVLATSRVPLGIPGEVVHPLEPLSLPETEDVDARQALAAESVQLFVDRVKEVNNRWVLDDDDAPHVTRICRLLGGHPLALELAAARIKAADPEQIATRLADNIELLKAGRRDARPDRQRTLTAAWGWSVEALDEPARRLFERLSVFRGGFSLEAVEIVCTDEHVDEFDVLDLLTELIDHGLVSYVGKARYRQLEPVRQFGARRLAERGEEELWRGRHAAHFAAVAGSAVLGFIGTPLMELSDNNPLWSVWDDTANMWHAAATIDATAPPMERLQFNIATAALLLIHAREGEGDQRLTAALEAVDDPLPPELDALVAGLQLSLRVGHEDREVARTATNRAIEAWDALDEPEQRAAVRGDAARAALVWGDLDDVLRFTDEGLAIADGTTHAVPELLAFRAFALRWLDRFDEAAAATDRAIKRARELDGPNQLVWATAQVGHVAEDRGEWRRAGETFEGALPILDILPPTHPGVAGMAEHAAIAWLLAGEIDHALALARRANEIFARADDRGIRFIQCASLRGDREPGDTERTMQRHVRRLALPPVEAAADLLVERLEEFRSRFERLGQTERVALADEQLAALHQAAGMNAA